MNDTPDRQPTDVLGDLDKVESLVATARRILSKGGMVDLSALEGKIGQLCDAAKEAPPAERERVIVALEKLIGALDELTKELTQQFGALGGETEDIKRERAADAYAKNTPKKPDGTA